VRPVHRMVAHSGFIIVSRRLASPSRAGAEPLPAPVESPILENERDISGASDSDVDTVDSDDDDQL